MSQRDALLSTIVSELESYELSITFESGGAIYSGSIITTATYFMETGKRLAEGFDRAGENGSAFVSTFDQLAGIASEQSQNSAEYIHLKDVTILIGGGARMVMPLWRARISEIAGFDLSGLGDPQ